MAEGGDLPKPTSEQLPKPEGTTADASAGMGLKFIPERFKLSSNEVNAKKASEQRLKEITNTRPDQLLKSSQWRRDALGSANKKGVVSFDESGGDPIQGNKQDQAAPNQGKPNK